MVNGINPAKLKEVCGNCGGRMRPVRNVGPYASVPCECAECESTGTIRKNRYGMVVGGYGAMQLEPANEDCAKEIGKVPV